VTGIAVLSVCRLFGIGYSATGQPSAGAARVTTTQSGRHQVTLKYDARRALQRVSQPDSGAVYEPSDQSGPIVADNDVDVNVASGHTYFYVARAQDGQGHESANSNEAKRSFRKVRASAI